MLPEVKSFLDEVANSLVKLEIVLFYVENPATVDSVQGISLRICREALVVEQAMQELAQHLVLERHELGSGNYVLYSLSQEKKTQSIAKQLSTAFHTDSRQRVEIIKNLMSHRERATTVVLDDRQSRSME